ncbi:PhzF family phenazine biosynthesis protein [Caballeronia sp. SEWSISQ10-4 2]|uniref:PhzF family phenazine biosynthesis protein n=1 Tax=Caballeronia sp. SEWSISQ10-4 2 TaxID=2937438 RepID=UPI00265398AE|nr:PhzF family phenazine biosynthesis protein [Caballeronia sp. SEWSISQ10-4 2]MDN7183619.1 PhzF family phenazine biosynthesis protein [Caballeronia sp. SEWSISQ10-4 2]
MQIDVHIVKAFLDGGSGGNPAGVVTDANMLTSEQKLAVAQRVGLSETAFVSTSERATIKLEFFTPARQIAHCGHATIATFSLLRELGSVDDGRLSKETVDGVRNVLVDGKMVFMEQRAPRYTRVAATSKLAGRVAASLRLSQPQIAVGIDPFVVSTSNPFLLISMPDEQSVAQLRPDFDRVEQVSNELDLIGYYLFSTTTKVPGRHAGARMFAPRFGIVEEAATGTAAGPLACLLYDHMGIKERTLLIEQGQLMESPSPSIIEVRLEVGDTGISRIMVGGTAKIESSVKVEM